MIRTTYHGTSLTNFLSMLQDGALVTCSETRNWNESFPALYVWECKSEWNEDEEDRCQEAQRNAENSAEMPLVDCKYGRRVVLEIDIAGLDSEDDTSCENMDGAIQVNADIPLDRIKRIWIDEHDISLVKMVVIGSLLNHTLYDWSNSATISALPNYVRETLKAQQIEWFWNEDFQLEETTIEKIKEMI